MNGAVFLDRDGTIISDKGYLRDPEAVELLAGAGQAIAALNHAQLLVLVVSNQSGVGRGLFPEQKIAAAHRKLDECLKNSNASVDSYYYCPHAPDEGCDCRKPANGMFLAARREFDIDVNRCWMVGDKLSDMEFARNCGMLPLLVRSGHGHRVGNYKGLTFDSLLEASTWILQQAATRDHQQSR